MISKNKDDEKKKVNNTGYYVRSSIQVVTPANRLFLRFSLKLNFTE